MASKTTPELRINQKYKAPVSAAVTTTTSGQTAPYSYYETDVLADIADAIATHSADPAGHTAFNWLALNSYNALWTTAGWGKSLQMPGPAHAVFWPKGSYAYAWGVGVSGDNFYITNSTANDNSAAPNYPIVLAGAGALTFDAKTGQSISQRVNGSDIAVTNVDRVMPGGSILKDLGDYNRKWRTLYAAELYVETLVAQNVLATIGGRIIVAPTAKLIADVNNSQTTIDTDYSSFLANDYIYFSSAPGGVAQIEVMKISGTPTTITGGYRYTVSRNLDGTGANSWVSGDAAVSLGNSTSKGYIDLSATSTIHGHIGPTIAIYSRSATTNWNDVKAVVAMGNLRSFVDYAADNMGFATGNDLTLTPTTGFKGVTIDRSFGLRLFNTDLKQYTGSTLTSEMLNNSGIGILEDTYGSWATERAIEWWPNLASKSGNPSLQIRTGKVTSGTFTDQNWSEISAYPTGGQIAQLTISAAGGTGADAAYLLAAGGSSGAPHTATVLLGANSITLSGTDNGNPFDLSTYTRVHGDPQTPTNHYGQLIIDPQTNDQDVFISLRTTRSTDRTWLIGAGSGAPNTNFRIYDYTGSAERLTIDSSGVVGIASATPTISDGIGLDITGKILRLRTSKTPASAAATGNAGEICWDSSFIYVCTATNTWKRAAIATW